MLVLNCNYIFLTFLVEFILLDFCECLGRGKESHEWRKDAECWQCLGPRKFLGGAYLCKKKILSIKKNTR